MKKCFKLFFLCLLASVLLGACGQGAKDVEVAEEDNKQAETDQSQEEEVSKEKEEAEEKTESKLGSRSNPVPFQSTATIEDELYDDEGNSYATKFDLTVLEVIRGEEAYQMLLSMNEFNEAAPEGYEWVLAKTKVKFNESETEDLAFHIDGTMNFEMVSESGDIYSGYASAVTEPNFNFEMYVGNEKEGYIPGVVKTGENAQLRYEEMLDGHVFFNLQ